MTWIFDPASVTVFPALLTAEYKKLPKDLAPAKALLCTGIKDSFNTFFIDDITYRVYFLHI